MLKNRVFTLRVEKRFAVAVIWKKKKKEKKKKVTSRTILKEWGFLVSASAKPIDAPLTVMFPWRGNEIYVYECCFSHDGQGKKKSGKTMTWLRGSKLIRSTNWKKKGK
jgi:hypothetical protein